MTVSIIAAVSENNVIGKDNSMPWRLPADMKHFKNKTMGHHIIMGEKTFESLKKALQGRTNIIVTNQENYSAENCIVVYSLEQALKIAEKNNEDEAFIIGGGQIYNLAMNVADKMYLTRIHASFEGDTFFPEYNEESWKIISMEDFKADETNRYDYSFLTLERAT